MSQSNIESLYLLVMIVVCGILLFRSFEQGSTETGLDTFKLAAVISAAYLIGFSLPRHDWIMVISASIVLVTIVWLHYKFSVSKHPFDKTDSK